MREYEFRGKDLDTGNWVYGDLHTLCDKPHIHTEHTHYPFAGKRVFVDPETIGQYTGLKDKNGKKIYEGDILRVIEWENILMFEWSDDPNRFDLFTLDEIKGKKRKEYTSAVFWDEGGFCIGSSPGDKDVPLCCLFGDMKRSSPIFEFEIVGNVYDNPELLRQNESE